MIKDLVCAYLLEDGRDDVKMYNEIRVMGN